MHEEYMTASWESHGRAQALKNLCSGPGSRAFYWKDGVPKVREGREAVDEGPPLQTRGDLHRPLSIPSAFGWNYGESSFPLRRDFPVPSSSLWPFRGSFLHV